MRRQDVGDDDGVPASARPGRSRLASSGPTRVMAVGSESCRLPPVVKQATTLTVTGAALSLHWTCASGLAWPGLQLLPEGGGTLSAASVRGPAQAQGVGRSQCWDVNRRLGLSSRGRRGVGHGSRHDGLGPCWPAPSLRPPRLASFKLYAKSSRFRQSDLLPLFTDTKASRLRPRSLSSSRLPEAEEDLAECFTSVCSLDLPAAEPKHSCDARGRPSLRGDATNAPLSRNLTPPRRKARTVFAEQGRSVWPSSLISAWPWVADGPRRRGRRHIGRA